MAAYDAHAGPRGRAFVSSSRPQRSTRSWTSNGVHYTVDTYSSPGLSFGSFTGSANNTFSPFGTSDSSAIASPFGLLGSALGLLDNTFAMHPQHTVVGNDLGQGSRRRVHLDTDSEDEASDLARDNGRSSNRRARPKSIFSRLKDRLVDNKHHSRRGDSSSRERSPPQRSRVPTNRNNSYHTNVRQPDWAEEEAIPDFIEVDYEDDNKTDSEPEYTHRPRPTSRIPAFTRPDNSMIDALENAVDMEKRNVRACKQRLAQASQQSNISSHHLQRIIDDLKRHESALVSATQDLNAVRASQSRKSRPPHPASRTHQRQQSHPQPRHSSSSRNIREEFSPPPRQRQSTRDMHEEFSDPFGGFPFPQRSHHPDPVFQAFQDLHGGMDPFSRASPFSAFEQFFEQHHPTADDAHFRFFAMPGTAPHGSQQKRSRTSQGPQFQQPGARPPSGFPGAPRASVQPPKPPATVLRPDEAKRLYKSYNDRWDALPAASPDIPYPARGLHAGGLAARDSLFAPFVNAHVGTWSEETVMQANAQAFFLGVVGLVPQYTQNPGTGRIEVGFDKTKASPAQIKDLMNILKKERNRWHSDRLGRRNGGSGGPNEGLQKDERTRAVFHAVCELMEAAQ